MIDTITLKFNVEINAVYLKSWEKRFSYKGTWMQTRYTYNNEEGENRVPIKCTYYPKSFKGEPLLLIEFSLARAVNGTNIPMFFDIEKAINKASNLISGIPALPKIDISKGELSRLDIFYNHQVGKYATDTINFLSDMEYPHRKTIIYLHETVIYNSNSVRTLFYDKFIESKSEQAQGILRQEIQIKGKKNIAQVLGVKQPFLINLSIDILADLLRKDLKRLNLNDKHPQGMVVAGLKLVEEFGHYAGLYNYGLLILRPLVSKKALADFTKFPPRSLNNRIKAIVEVGITPNYLKELEELPPLKISIE